MVLVTPFPTKLGDFLKPVDTSSQVSTPNDAEMEDTSLEEIATPSSPQLKPQGPAVMPLPQMQLISGKRPTRL